MLDTKFNNFRDLDESFINQNTKIKSGMIFRSADLSINSKEDKDFLNAKNFHYILDLRCPCEAKETKDYIKKGVFYINSPIFDEKQYKYLVVTKHARLLNAMLRKEKIKRLINSKIECYKEMPFSKGFNEAFKLMDKGESFVFHCSEGKDRTGILAALITYLLGGTIEECKRCFLLSNTKRPEKDRSNLRKYGLPEELILSIKYCESVHEELFDLVISEILKKYSTLEEYFEKEFNITKERIEIWRNLYLEKI